MKSMLKLTMTCLVAAAMVAMGPAAFAETSIGDPNVKVSDGGILRTIDTGESNGNWQPSILAEGSDPRAVRLTVSNGNGGALFHFNAYGPSAPGALVGSAGLFGSGNQFVLGSTVGTPILLTSGGAFSTRPSGDIFISTGGDVGVGTDTPTVKLDVAGDASVDVLNIKGGGDVAEKFDIAHPKGAADVAPKAGMVVCIDPEQPGKLIVSSKPYDRTVAGVISGAGGVNTGLVLTQTGNADTEGEHPVALTGRVYCLVDATEEAITPGDMLTTSSVPGHAMKITDYQRGMGASIGKAMTPLEKGKIGLVYVLVNLH